MTDRSRAGIGRRSLLAGTAILAAPQMAASVLMSVPVPVCFAFLQKHLTRTTALHGLSLDIADGEFLIFLRPSGSDKTTTLRTPCRPVVDQWVARWRPVQPAAIMR